MISEMRQFIKLSMEKSDSVLKDSMIHLLKERNDLMQDIDDVKRLQERIVSKANALLDEKNFQKTQEMIKRANEIPPKITYLVKRGDEAFYIQKNYRQASRHYKDASNLAEKINQAPITKLLEKKAKRADEIPQFIKTWSLTYDQIVKPLRKIEKRNTSFYLKPIKLIDRAIEISDYLEDDKTIEDLQKLADYLERANSLSVELKSLDKKIKDVIKKVKR
jgi:tetratricopeptide (TPR) repeat protein